MPSFRRPLLLEGPAVFLAAAALSRQHPGLHSSLGRIVILAGAGAASLTFANIAAEGLATDSLLAALKARQGGFVPSINSTGAFLALPGLMAVGAMVANRNHRRLWLSAAVMMLTAMLLTRTRAAIIPTFTIISCVLIWWIRRRGSRLLMLRTSALVALALTAGGLLIAAFNPFELLGPSADSSLRYRLATAQIAIQMVKEHALFGVGIANYPAFFAAFRHPIPDGLFGAGVEEVHNYFLWIAAELGLIGLMGFLWLIGTAVRKLWQRLRIDSGDWEFLGMSAGIAAFLLTCVLGNRLSFPKSPSRSGSSWAQQSHPAETSLRCLQRPPHRDGGSPRRFWPSRQQPLSQLPFQPE